MILLVTATPLWSFDPTVRPGSFVAANMGDGYWCRGTALAISLDTAEFISTDGRKIVLPASKLIPFSKDVDLNPGDAVLAAWDNDAILYPGKVKAADAEGAIVEWEDGGRPSLIAKDKLVRPVDAGRARFQYDAPAAERRPASDPERFKPGDTAAALFPDGRWYLGVLGGKAGDEYPFVTEDGRQMTLAADKLRALLSEPSLAVGDPVGAVWGRESRFSAGSVLATANGGAIIEWMDGMKPCFVENRKILVGVESFRKARDVSVADKRLTFRTGSTVFVVSYASGRIYANSTFIGRFDAASGAVVAAEGVSSRAQVAEDGTIRSFKKKVRGGRLERSGGLFLGDRVVGAIGRDGWIYRGSTQWASLDIPKPTWSELRMITAVLVLCTEDFGF
ncbi:MAG: hypothetical protein WCT14_11190 [Treponemataceae bacterium]